MLLAVGALILIGWQFRIPLLKGQFRGTFITPVTALHFMLLAAALLILQNPAFVQGPAASQNPSLLPRALRWFARIMALFVSVWAFAVCFEFVSGQSLGIDGIFFAHRMQDWTISKLPAGRYVWPTALAFAFAGLSVATLNWPGRGARLSETLGSPVALVTLLAIIGHLFSINQLYGGFMAIPTGILFAVLTVNIFMVQKAPSLASEVLGETAGGIVARRLLLVTFLFLPLMGWLRLKAQAAGINENVASALRVIVELFFFSILIWRTSIILDRLDQYRKNSERVLQQQEKLATLGRYAATIAHEINNPLAAATNLVYLASLDDTKKENRLNYLRTCQSELSRIAHVVRHTLGFYRENTAPVPIDIGELFRDLVFSFKQKLASKSINVTTSSPEGAQVVAVRGELIQIISNLLSNAIDAAPDATGRVNLRAVYQGTNIALRVEDNGPGVPPDAMEHIFEPFFSTKKEFGTGIGLWLSRELAKKNQATIQLESQPGETCFALILPATSTESLPAPRAELDRSAS